MTVVYDNASISLYINSVSFSEVSRLSFLMFVKVKVKLEYTRLSEVFLLLLPTVFQLSDTSDRT